MTGGRKNLQFSANTEIHALDLALGVRCCELRFRSHRAFTHASLSRIPLCISWAILVSPPGSDSLRSGLKF